MEHIETALIVLVSFSFTSTHQPLTPLEVCPKSNFRDESELLLSFL